MNGYCIIRETNSRRFIYCGSKNGIPILIPLSEYRRDPFRYRAKIYSSRSSASRARYRVREQNLTLYYKDLRRVPGYFLVEDINSI